MCIFLEIFMKVHHEGILDSFKSIRIGISLEAVWSDNLKSGNNRRSKFINLLETYELRSVS